MTKQKGFARFTAATQTFLDTCPAVRSWTPTADRHFVEFTFDPTVEGALAPPGVYFDPDRAEPEEREEFEASRSQAGYSYECSWCRARTTTAAWLVTADDEVPLCSPCVESARSGGREVEHD